MQSTQFKVSLIGDTGTGKTAFIENLLYGQSRIITPSLRQTIGVDVTPFDYKYLGNRYRINFWDCAGDSRYIGLGKGYITNSDLVVLFNSDNQMRDQQFLEWIPSHIPHLIINNILNTQAIIISILNRL
jgi:GTPase SAR1 family protein